jgi:hypothetical protein
LPFGSFAASLGASKLQSGVEGTLGKPLNDPRNEVEADYLPKPWSSS